MMKMRVWMTIAALVLSSLACTITIQMPGFERVSGSGNVILVERSVSDFTAVQLGGVGTLHIEMADEEVLRIEAEDNLTQYIVSEVREGTLYIELRQNVNIDPNVLRSSDGWCWGGPATMLSTRETPHSRQHFDEADSPHDGVVQAALADGSVRQFSFSIDERTWQNLGNRSQGSPVDLGF